MALCECCKKREVVKNIQRGLCNSCYAYLRREKCLDLYPKVKERLIDTTYSDEELNDFRSLAQDVNANLSRLSKKYGYTRENARQLFERINGYKYTAVKKQRVAANKEAREVASMMKRDPRIKVLNYKRGSKIAIGAEAEKKVLNICDALGYEVKPYTRGNQIDLIINDYKVEVKSAYAATLTSPGAKTPQYHFHLLDSQRHCDFVACYAAPINKFFVIPIEEFPQGGHLYLPSVNKREWTINGNVMTAESKYYRYIESWWLLRHKRETPVFCNPEKQLSQVTGS